MGLTSKLWRKLLLPFKFWRETHTQREKVYVRYVTRFCFLLTSVLLCWDADRMSDVSGGDAGDSVGWLGGGVSSINAVCGTSKVDSCSAVWGQVRCSVSSCTEGGSKVIWVRDAESAGCSGLEIGTVGVESWTDVSEISSVWGGGALLCSLKHQCRNVTLITVFIKYLFRLQMSRLHSLGLKMLLSFRIWWRCAFKKIKTQTLLFGFSLTVICSGSYTDVLTFNVDFCWRRVGTAEVGGEAGISSRVFFESFSDDQRVLISETENLNIRTVFQLFTLTKPPKKQKIITQIWMNVTQRFTRAIGLCDLGWIAIFF